MCAAPTAALWGLIPFSFRPLTCGMYAIQALQRLFLYSDAVNQRCPGFLGQGKHLLIPQRELILKLLQMISDSIRWWHLKTAAHLPFISYGLRRVSFHDSSDGKYFESEEWFEDWCYWDSPWPLTSTCSRGLLKLGWRFLILHNCPFCFITTSHDPCVSHHIRREDRKSKNCHTGHWTRVAWVTTRNPDQQSDKG